MEIFGCVSAVYELWIIGIWYVFRVYLGYAASYLTPIARPPSIPIDRFIWCHSTDERENRFQAWATHMLSIYENNDNLHVYEFPMFQIPNKNGTFSSEQPQKHIPYFNFTIFGWPKLISGGFFPQLSVFAHLQVHILSISNGQQNT